ncbi:fatty acid desaturase-domain-containing protein [Roridomyces roridus]|uniref:Fatty acid desaturase-domain-containing protein n=1 Tax=Roridomyces roridus TaxID=1738132 RepID=A0AAD7BRQ6_9AGAR|nr:fatty acid desaturase-domain-containing protein [Roridomyces roridus]
MFPAMFKDSNEYLARKGTPFVPPDLTISQIRKAIPAELHKKSTAWGLWILVRHVLCVSLFYYLGTKIDSVATPAIAASLHCGPTTTSVIRWSLWVTYWFWQGVGMAGLWCYGHEAGHGTISDHDWLNQTLGYLTQTCLLTPYFAWRSTHRAHHKAVGSMERDENYVPALRSDLKLKSEDGKQAGLDYHEVFEDTPIYTLGMMLVMQILGLQLYFVANTMGSPSYPKGTNHFSPTSALFKRNERLAIVASDAGLLSMLYLLWGYTERFGLAAMLKMYFVPYLLCNHWIVLITFLHHCDPTLPHYRKAAWTFVRGAIGTVDRPIMGWIGRFFFLNVSHDHVAHHLFSSIPFYNQPQVTEHLKRVLGEHYNYDPTPCFRALYRSFTECAFVEDEGDIIFYKNMKGESVRFLQADDSKSEESGSEAAGDSGSE